MVLLAYGEVILQPVFKGGIFGTRRQNISDLAAPLRRKTESNHLFTHGLRSECLPEPISRSAPDDLPLRFRGGHA